MVLVLAISDLNVPFGSPGLPEKFEKMLVPGKIQYVLVPGNLNTKNTEHFLASLGAELHVTHGDMDIARYPERLVLTVGSVVFGLIHGHQIVPWGDVDAVCSLKRDMGVDVLVYGFSHELLVMQPDDGGLIVNPGSATGAVSVLGARSGGGRPPSFVLMDVLGSRIVVYVYTIHNDDVNVERTVYEKTARASTS
eukprot:CAMPEP_0185831478 /NCGR_PEP_ID=MMETSP1353-20130828/1508_1 /TAXON_ID=1077150 /ORGANISM="Erythrolobus australicus, Strain CCMP3124" /LENGTH=193 /DNA_ID=CAMNT_0028529535 /DNA_START=94 /DNA_END=672 /DNA_ORIENTATION=-